MGTNYYWRPIMTEEQKEDLENKIKSSKTIQEIKKYINENYEHSEVHIGKKSYGWQFLFWLGIREYTNLDRESIVKWLDSGLIYDEYEDIISTSDFMKKVNKCVGDYTYEDYYNEHLEELRSYFIKGEDQIIDDLRFTKDLAEFS